MFDVFYREVQYFQPDYGNSYTEPGPAQLYRSFTTEAEAESAAAGLEFLCGADIYDAWSEEAQMHESELLETLCRPLAEYLRTKCTPPISIEVTDYGFFVNCGDDGLEYHAIP